MRQRQKATQRVPAEGANEREIARAGRWRGGEHCYNFMHV